MVVGTHKLKSGGTKYAVNYLKWHENYDSTNIKNDVGILMVSKDFSFTDKVKAIKLTASFIGQGEILTLTGWGTTSVSVSKIKNTTFSKRLYYRVLVWKFISSLRRWRDETNYKKSTTIFVRSYLVIKILLGFFNCFDISWKLGFSDARDTFFIFLFNVIFSIVIKIRW